MSSAPRTPAQAGLALRFRQVAMRFITAGGEVEALRDCSLEVRPGSFVSIIGPNGSGKSTLLRIAAGLLQPTTGSVTVGDREPRVGDGRVSLAFQQPRLVPWLTTAQNVALPLELAGVPSADVRQRARRALERVGLADAGRLRLRELSGGMQQRAALARALITEPAILLMDEPFSALDALTRESFNVELERLWMDRRRTVILVTHSVTEAVQLADTVAVMSQRPGRIEALIEVDLPRPRSAMRAEDPHVAATAARVREVLDEMRSAEVRPWSGVVR